jgi:hypothetical protein
MGRKKFYGFQTMGKTALRAIGEWGRQVTMQGETCHCGSVAVMIVDAPFHVDRVLVGYGKSRFNE